METENGNIVEHSIGGKLQGIGLDAFLQMAQTEQITCTLSVTSGDRTGRLFLLDGKLISAETGTLSNIEAAHRIISWEKSVIDIIESCSKTADEIKQPLINILMEAMRLRDEAKSNPSPESKDIENKENNNPGPDSDKSAPTEKAPPGDNAAGTQKKPGKPRKQPDPGTKTPKNAEKKPAETTADTASNSKGPRKKLSWKILISCLVILLVIFGFVAYFLSAAKRDRLAYESFMRTVQEAETPEQKLNLLNIYISKNPDSPHSEEILHKTKDLTKALDEKTFNTVEETASRLADDDALEEATRVYEKYLAENKESQYKEKAQAALKGLLVRIDNKAFREMETAAESLGPERISLYQDFMKQHPGSSHREEVLSAISAMEDEYFTYIEQKIAGYEENRNWAACIELSQQYLALYPESNHAETVTKWLVKHRNQYQASRSFENLCKQAENFGADHKAALAVFTDYLKIYPGTPAREKIEQEIERLHLLTEKKRLGDAADLMVREVLTAGTRFSVENDETVLDTTTGLMWALLDSQVIENRCLTYKEADAYVSSLKTGGYDDWRLPSPEELKTLYFKTPAFPFEGDNWYWSSKNDKRYAGQWIINIRVIDPNNPDEKDTLMKESWQCGAVRAVRRKK